MLLLQVSLGKVLQLTLGEFKVGWASNGQLSAVSGDNNIVGSEGSSLVVDLDLFLEVSLEHGNIQNLIVDWCGAVNDEFDNALLSLSLES